MFPAQLDELKARLARMAGQAELAVARALQALMERDDPLARRVEQDDSILDAFEMEIDELSVRLLAEAPVPSMRQITVAMKVAHDLERIGDEATTISRRIVELNAQPPLPVGDDLPKMAELGLRILREAIDAFTRGDAARARAIIPHDKAIDVLHKQIQRELTRDMTERADFISQGLPLLGVARSLERIGDHATNIAEETVYLLEGRIIRHDPAAKAKAVDSSRPERENPSPQ